MIIFFNKGEDMISKEIRELRSDWVSIYDIIGNLIKVVKSMNVHTHNLYDYGSNDEEKILLIDSMSANDKVAIYLTQALCETDDVIHKFDEFVYKVRERLLLDKKRGDYPTTNENQKESASEVGVECPYLKEAAAFVGRFNVLQDAIDNIRKSMNNIFEEGNK